MANCIICNSDNYKVIYKRNQYKLLKCKNCGLIKTHPAPLFDYEDAKVSFQKDNIPLFDIYAQELLDIILPYKKNGTLLDIGCSIGLLVKKAKEHGFAASGIELSNDAARFAVENFHLDIHSLDLLKLQLPSNSFDVVVMNHVLEHIGEPANPLAEIKRILAPGGILLIGVPNMESLSVRLFLPFLTGINLKEHLWHFSKTALNKLLIKNGFSITKNIISEPYQPYSRSVKGLIKRIICQPFYFMGGCLGMGRNLFVIAGK